jgi:hypothetical protein
MALRYDCEGVLSTIEWAHTQLASWGEASGYAMDKVMARRVQLSRSKPDSAQGLFARYLRGDNVPRGETQGDLLGHDLHAHYPSLPLWGVLRVGLAGYASPPGADRVRSLLDELQGRFERRITRFEGPGLTYVALVPSKAISLDLAAYGSCHATAVLLAMAMDVQDIHDSEAQQRWEGEPAYRGVSALLLGQRAFQCLMLAFAADECPVTAPLVAARVRQQVLDGLNADGKVLDTAAVDVDAAIEVAREAIEQSRAVSRSRYKQRAWLRNWLQSADERVALITPAITTAEAALASRQARPVLLTLRLSSGTRRRHVSVLGKRAKEKLMSEMRGYVTKATNPDPPAPVSAATDTSGPRHIPGNGPSGAGLTPAL